MSEEKYTVALDEEPKLITIRVADSEDEVEQIKGYVGEINGIDMGVAILEYKEDSTVTLMLIDIYTGCVYTKAEVPKVVLSVVASSRGGEKGMYREIFELMAKEMTEKELEHWRDDWVIGGVDQKVKEPETIQIGKEK